MLISADIDDKLLIMDWGGWKDLETFLENYRGSYSPTVQRAELQKVDWLDAEGSPNTGRDPRTALLQQTDEETASGAASSPV